MGISQQIGASSAIKAGVCTSSTRPASPYEGQMIYETDTDLVLVWSGSAWVETASMLTKAPRGLVTSIVTRTASYILTTSQVTQLTSASFTAVTGRLYRITYYEPRTRATTDAAGNGQGMYIYNGATQMQRITIPSTPTNTLYSSASCIYVGTLTAGATVITARADTSSTTGTAAFQNDATMFAFLTIEDIGAA